MSFEEQLQKEKEDRGKFGKDLLKEYLDSKCERQLFLRLGEKKSVWRLQDEKVEHSDRYRRISDLSKKLGHDYEQKVYHQLMKFTDQIECLFNEKEDGSKYVKKTDLYPQKFKNLYEEIIREGYQSLFILEGEFPTSFSFKRSIFKEMPHCKQIPVEFRDQRPDICLIHNFTQNTPTNLCRLELLPSGYTRLVCQEELKERLAISIFDVKRTNEKNVGKPYFFEIFFYLINLAHYLKINKLDHLFFIDLTFNGIFPKYTNEELKTITSFTQFNEKIIKIEWEEIKRVYFRVIKQVQSLWDQTPCSHTEIPLNINTNCGYCRYLKDCLKSLGKTEDSKPANWSIELIPYTSSSVIQQLKALNFKTIGDIADHLENLKIGNTPQPIYAEIPLLKIKAQSLKKNDVTYPDPADIHSYAIPRFTEISLTFAIEEDPVNEQVFGYSLLLGLSIHPKNDLYFLFENWWKIWRLAIEKDYAPEIISKKLKNVGFIEEKALSFSQIKIFKDILKDLQNKGNLRIAFKGDLSKNKKKRYNSTFVTYRTSDINSSLKDITSEGKLAVSLITDLYQIFELAHFIEEKIQIVKERQFKKKVYSVIVRPNLGVFYWGEEQLEHLQEMLQHNLEYIMEDQTTFRKLSHIMSWFNPSDSEVTHPYQHKKLYNLKTFIETVLGFPSVINYTWHQIASYKFDFKKSKPYWLDYFNYMDYSVWYRYIEAKGKEREVRRKKIKNQLEIKTIYINKIRMEYQNKARNAIANNSKPLHISKFTQKMLPDTFHGIAYVWFFFSKLTGTLEEYRAEYFRTIFPEYSIGKLEAAKVSDFVKMPRPQNKFQYYFHLKGLSSNMKINNGDYVLLIPEELRDMKMGNWSRKWIVVIEHLKWAGKKKGYACITKETRYDLKEEYKTQVSNPKDKIEWYLFKHSTDPWSQKLYGLNAGGLLERYNFGTSWLGKRLSYLWNIKSQKKLRYPKKLEALTPEIYLFAPTLIQPKKSQLVDFQADVAPFPDNSQVKAIKEALSHTIYAIQGPPGTGKSQTIAALVNEFLFQQNKNGKRSRILITAFSYAAIRVMIDKIRKSKKSDGSMSQAAQIQQIFLRSMSQDPVSDEIGQPNINDLVRKSSGTWQWNGKTNEITKKHLLEDKLENDFIIYGNAHQLFRLTERVKTDFYFDLIIVDEASQLPTDYFMSSLQFVRKKKYIFNSTSKDLKRADPNKFIISAKDIENLEILNKTEEDNLTKVVIVGDYNQLPPVQPVEPPKNLEWILDSLFSYYVRYLEVPSTQLRINYRSHRDIVEFTSELEIYDKLTAYKNNATKTIRGKKDKIHLNWCREILDPSIITSTVIHHQDFEIAVSTVEAEIVANLAVEFYRMQNPQSPEEETIFWQEKIGVVSPHNAQGRVIVHKIYDQMVNPKQRLTQFPDNDEGVNNLMKNLTSTVYSVEKFQGSDRDFIIASVGISDRDQLNAEDEFIYDLNRFNVLTSRAKSKVVVVCSENYLNFIPNDRNIMKQAFQSHRFALEHCNQEKPIFFQKENQKYDYVLFRWKNNLDDLKPLGSSFQYNGIIQDPTFIIEFTPNPFLENQIHRLSTKIQIQNVSNNQSKSSLQRWKFEFKDIEKINSYIPIPNNIAAYYQEKIKKTQRRSAKKKKILKEKVTPKLNTDYGDSTDQPLF